MRAATREERDRIIRPLGGDQIGAIDKPHISVTQCGQIGRELVRHVCRARGAGRRRWQVFGITRGFRRRNDISETLAGARGGLLNLSDGARPCRQAARIDGAIATAIFINVKLLE